MNQSSFKCFAIRTTHPFLVLHLVSNEGWVKRLLQLYKRLVQPYRSLLSITGDAFRHFLPVRHTHF